MTGAPQLPAVFVAQVAIPELGVRAGDRVLVWCSGGSPIQLQRDLVPSYGAIVRAYQDNQLAPLEQSDRDAIEALALRPPTATRAGKRRGAPRHAPTRPRLTLV